MIYEIENIVLVNELPEDAHNFNLSSTTSHLTFYSPKSVDSDSDGFNIIRIPNGDFELIGLHSAESQLSEEKCAECVDRDWEYKKYYKNYMNDRYCYLAKNSFASLLKANDLHLVNSIDESGNSFEWFERESRTGPFIVLKRK